MKMFLKYRLIMVMLLTLLATSGTVAQVTGADNGKSDIYYDATKQKLLGNYDKAAELFEKHLEKYPDDPAAMYELASLYKMQNKKDEALDLAARAVTINPNNKWYKVLLVELYQDRKDFRAAAKIIKNLIEQYPDNIEFRQDLALNYIYENDYKSAIEIYDEIERLIGVTEQISIQKQKLYLLMGKEKDAIREIEKLTEAYPEEPRFLEMLAELYMNEEDFDQALEIYNKILEVDPGNPYINISLSDFYRKQGDEEKSFEYLKKGFANPELDIDTKVQILLAYYTVNEIYNDLKEEAFELAGILVEAHPDDPKSYSIYADLLYQDKQFEEARKSFLKVISLDSGKYLVWEQLLFVESELGDFRAMADESERAIELFPQQPLLYLFSGVANYQLKNYDKSIRRFETGKNFVVGNDKLLAQFWSYLGDGYHQQGQNNDAYMAYEKALELDPDNSIVLNNYAYYLSLDGIELEKAEEMSKKAVDLDPENSANQDTHGWVLYKMGKYEEAKKWIGKAINDPEAGAVVLEHYGDVLFKLGKEKEALKYWEKAKKEGEGSEFLEKKIRDKTLYE